MYDLNDFIRNSSCITNLNYKLVQGGSKFADLLEKYERIYVSDDFVYSGINATMNDELFFLKDQKDHLNEAWWQKNLCYVFNVTLAAKEKNVFPVSLAVKTENNMSDERVVVFDLLKIKHDIYALKSIQDEEKQKQEIVKVFLDNLYVNKDGLMIKFSKNYITDILQSGLSEINNFAALILAVSVPVIMIVGHLDEDLTNAFRAFLENFLNMFLDSPFKS